MAIDVECSDCGAGFQVPYRLNGKLIRCTSCRKEFRVNSGKQTYDWSDEGPRRKRSSWLVPLLIVGGVLVVCLKIAVLVFIGAALDGGAGPNQRDPQLFAPQVVDPPPALVRNAAPRRMLPRHMLVALEPPGMAFGRRSPADGPTLVTLSDIRRGDDMMPGRPVYLVDYEFAEAGYAETDEFDLVVKSPVGTAETRLNQEPRDKDGTTSFGFLGPIAQGQHLEVWVELKSADARFVDRPKRVSNVVTID